MTVRKTQLFSKGQFKPALILTPQRLSIRYRILSALVALLLYGTATFLWTYTDSFGELIICCIGLGSFALLLALFKPSFEVIQEDEVRLRLSFGPFSLVGKRTPLHSDFPYHVGFNNAHEVIISANQGSSQELQIGPFDSEEQAHAILEEFRYLDLSESRNREARTARAQQEIKDITLNVRPGLPRFYQITVVGVVLLGLIQTDFKSPIIAPTVLLAFLVFTELWIVSTTNVEETSRDQLHVKFTRRHRYFWIDTYSMNPVQPEDLVYLGRSFNWRVYIPVLLFFIGSFVVLFKAASASARTYEPPPVPRKTTNSQQENEDRRRGIELLNEAKRLRDSRKKEEGERPEPTDP